MTSSRIVAAAAALLLAVPSALADVPSATADARRADAAAAAPVPPRWMPSWLMQAISNALADASDPRERPAAR